MHAALTGLNGIACIADDVLITGSGATLAEATLDYNRNKKEKNLTVYKCR